MVLVVEAWAVAVMSFVLLMVAWGVCGAGFGACGDFAVQAFGLVVMTWGFCCADFDACGKGLSGCGDVCRAYGKNLGLWR